MTEKTDELARNAALHAIGDAVSGSLDYATRHAYDYGASVNTQLVTDAVIGLAASVTWEREVNEHGQPVRRYVLRGAWEVDPEARELHWRQILDRGAGA
jgi:hypothetical protein